MKYDRAIQGQDSLPVARHEEKKMEASNTTVGQLSVTYRNQTGSSAVRKLRQQGLIPGICYGKGVEPMSITLDPKALKRALDPDKRTNTLITMNVSGNGAGDQQLTVMLRDWQEDALRGDVIHADFVRVRLDQEVHVEVPIVLTGKAEGVKLGGTLHQVYRRLAIACTPDKIPTQIEVAVDNLNMGDALHVSNINLPAGVKAQLDSGTTICTVTAPKAEKAAAEQAAEGAAPAEGAAAAPAAAGAAAPAAAGAKAGGKDEKGGGEKKK
ncbi:MAG TPA: 50S ribosomal protein L25 [Polyangia bacterium]|nr:50S ribosomal protein L25 [Polyangia bacterium]